MIRIITAGEVIKMLTEEEHEIIHYALSMRAGYIETGDALMRAVDAKRSGHSKLIRPLSTEQMKLLIKIDDLMSRCLNDKL
jgi:hypothetical protein